MSHPGCLIGILAMVLFESSPNWVVFHPLRTLNNPFFFSLLTWKTGRY